MIDFNPHPVRRDDLDHPDELRVDLDPTPEVGWAEVRKTAMVVDEVLNEHGLRGYPKTRGSKGIHVNVRIEPIHDYIEVRRAALALAREVERRAPDLATSKWWKEERHGVFVDYNQNARDRTVASGYSVRPTPDARVSCALAWDEVPDAEPGDLRLDTVPERLKTVGDPAADIDLVPGSLDALLDLARRDEEGGLGDAPWPPHFPKQRGEPKRVQPSRDTDRPTHRGRAGDPQPGGPPPGFTLGNSQRGFGSKAPDRPGLRGRLVRGRRLVRKFTHGRPGLSYRPAHSRSPAPLASRHEVSPARADRGAGRRRTRASGSGDQPRGDDPQRPQRASPGRRRHLRQQRSRRRAGARPDLELGRAVPAGRAGGTSDSYAYEINADGRAWGIGVVRADPRTLLGRPERRGAADRAALVRQR